MTMYSVSPFDPRLRGASFAQGDETWRGSDENGAPQLAVGLIESEVSR